MNAYRANGGYSGMEYDRWVEQRAGDSSEKSPITKLQQQYWVTKQTVFRKFGKKEDECVVASDAELDAKLELFRSIQESCMDLQRIIEKYQERLCTLAQEENAMGRFLKDAAKSDKTRAGKMMTAVGKSLSYSGQQRLALRIPLLRLHQEVETFRHRAIDDTLGNVRSMEKVRTEYRASLSWMKNVSTELDPDTFQQLDRFRKVQGQVRRSKSRFDKLKLDCLQKVDLLAAARCNMFSHALILYQNSLIQFSEKTSKTFTTITNSFKGYQHYEFCVIKELAGASSQLAEQSNGKTEQEIDQDTIDTDKLLFFESEYKDEPDTPLAQKSDSFENIGLETEASLLDLTIDNTSSPKQGPDASTSSTDLLASASDLALLDEILRADQPETPELYLLLNQEPCNSGTFLPSNLLDKHFQESPMLPSEMPEKPSASGKLERKTSNKEKRAWLDLFADLDPLADPDSVGRSETQTVDRNC